MGLSITYRQHIYDQIKTAETNSKVKLTPALRREIFDLYANMIMKPTMTPEETIEFIELHPRKVNRPIRPLRRFNAAERAERKKKALTLNRLQRDYCIDQGETVKFYGNKGTKNERSFEREPQQFFIIPEPGATEEELAKINQHNTEVAFLFNKKETWSKYSEEENKQFARRRAEIMLNRLADNYETVKNLPNLVDENLSPEELAKNYRKVINTCNLFTCIEVYCQDATNSFTGMNNFYDFKEEEIKLLYDTYRPLIADATNYQLRALMIANPAYEFLDIDGLQDYDVEDLDHGLTKEIGVFECDDESDFLEGDAKKFYQKMERKGHVNRTAQLEKMEPDIQDEFFKRHTKDADENEDENENENENEKKPLIFTPEQTKAMTKFFKELTKTKIPRFLHDPVSDLFADYDFYYQTMRYEIQDNFKKVKQDYLLGGSDTTLYSERITKDGFEFTNDANEHRLYEGIPVALEKNDRVIILTPNQSDGMGGVTVDKPESLYNYGLKKEFSTFTKRLKDADPLLLKSSSQYKEMQKSLAEIGKLAELQPGQSTAKAYLKFQKLLNSTEIYLRHKEDGVMDDDDRSSIELRRVKAARDLRKFALAKLKELELTNQARATLNKYNDMDPEARKEALAAEDARAKELKQRAAADKAARKAREEQEAAPLDWFEKQMKTPDRVASLPKAFQDAFATQIKQLKNELVPDTDDTSEHFYEDFSTYQQQLPTQLAHTLGGMIAAELILQERKNYDMGKPGPLETFFSHNNDNANENSPLYQALLFLGEDALKKALKKADLKKDFDHIESLTLDEREVKKLLENFHAADYVAPDSAKEFAKKHVYSIPMEMFEKDYSQLVPAGLDQSIKENLSGFYLEKPDQLDRLLAGSVIAAEMIAKERELLFDGNAGPIETALMQDGKDGLRKLGDKVLEHCPGMADSNDVMTAFYLMDPAKLADELTFDFRKEHGLSTSLEGSLKEQYCSIKPLRGDKLDDYEQVLAGYANMQILEPLQKYGPDLDVISEEDSRTILSSCALCSMVIMERAKGGEQPGVMESLLLKDPEQFEAIRHNIETSPDFNKLISPALTPNGIPVSSLSYMTKLLKDTGLVVNIIDNTKEVIKQKQPASEKAKEKAQPTAQASRRRRCRERLERNRRQKAQAPKKA